jgi:hypothetical protein
MVKHGNNPSGKSDRHQQHNLKYAASHAPAALERWYEKITTPKPDKIVYRVVKEVKPKRRVGRDPIKVAAKKAANQEYWARKHMALNDVNIK